MGHTLGNSVLEKQTSALTPIVQHPFPMLPNCLFTLQIFPHFWLQPGTYPAFLLTPPEPQTICQPHGPLPHPNEAMLLASAGPCTSYALCPESSSNPSPPRKLLHTFQDLTWIAHPLWNLPQLFRTKLIAPTSMFQENFAIASVAAFITLVTGLGLPFFLWAHH